MRKITRPFRLALVLLLLQSPRIFAADNKEAAKALNDFFEAEWN